MAGAPGRNRDRRPARSHRRGDPHGARGRHHPRRGQGPRDRADHRRPRCCRSTMLSSLGSARRERALDLRRDRRRDRRTASAPFEVTGVTFDSREVGPGDLFIAMPGTVYDGHKFVDGRLRSRRRRGNRLAARRRPARAGRRHVRRARRRSAARRASESKAPIIGVTGSVGKTSTKEALYAALDRNRAGQGPSLGQKLQQPYGRAAEPRPDAARSLSSRCSKWA